MKNIGNKSLKKVILGLIISALIGFITDYIIKAVHKKSNIQQQTNINSGQNNHKESEIINQILAQSPIHKEIWKKINQICPNCSNKRELLQTIADKYPNEVNVFKKNFNNVNYNDIENIKNKIYQLIPVAQNSVTNFINTYSYS